MDILSNQNNFASLSLRDLLEARDQYHVHLLNKRNVVGTAERIEQFARPRAMS